MPIPSWSWLPYPDPSTELTTLKLAIALIDANIKLYKPCNEAFKALSLGKTFEQVWNDLVVWISLDPSNQLGKYGACMGRKHITISKYSLRMGKWAAAATLVHELAHVGGAGGLDTAAEDTLLKCLLRDFHDPGVLVR